MLNHSTQPISLALYLVLIYILLPERFSTVLAINLGENIINYFHQQQGQKVTIVQSAIKILPIAEEENDAISFRVCCEKVIEVNKATC